MTQTQFITRLTKILGDDFFLCDMIWQEDLFDKQEKLSELIMIAANEGLPLAKTMVKHLPKTFLIVDL